MQGIDWRAAQHLNHFLDRMREEVAVAVGPVGVMLAAPHVPTHKRELRSALAQTGACEG